MANVQESLQVVLTGERLGEFEAVKDILLSLGVKESGLSTQQVVSAALQTLIGHHKVGGKLTYRFKDGRYGKRRAK